MDVYVVQAHAWAPGLDTPDAWQQWAGQAGAISGDDKPAASMVPAMTRRRLSRWGRQALEVATAVTVADPQTTPVIFSSRHGDCERNYKLLESLAVGEPLSPNAFSLSVHNSALGIYTILTGCHAPSLALAGGPETFAVAWTEALAWLAADTGQVLLVHTDEPLCDFYRHDADEQEMSAGLALLLSAKALPGAVRVSLKCSAGNEFDEGLQRSLIWQFLAWWFGSSELLRVSSGRYLWQWQRYVD